MIINASKLYGFDLIVAVIIAGVFAKDTARIAVGLQPIFNVNMVMIIGYFIIRLILELVLTFYGREE